MTAIQTPISEAASRYKALRRRRRRLSPQDRVWYYQLRYLQNHTRQWRDQRKDALEEMAGESLATTKRTLEDWKEFHTWLVAQGESLSTKASRAAFRPICTKVDLAVARVQEVIDDYADDETRLETIVESIVAAALPLGLEPYDPWEEADDGAVWFVNPDTGHKHYFLVGQHHEGWQFEVMSRPIPSHRVEQGDDRWRQYPGLNLAGAVLSWSNPNLTHPARWLDAYFGVYNSLGIVERDVPDSVDAALSRLRGSSAFAPTDPSRLRAPTP